MKIVSLLLIAFLSVCPAQAFSGECGSSMSPLMETDVAAELIMGPTNINGVVGNGTLTAGISLWGELTVLHWPSPSYYDHVRYTTANGFPGENCNVRMKPEVGGSYGANLRPIVLSDNMGSFGGIFYKTALEPAGRISYFRDNDWLPAQTYQERGVPVLLSTYTHDKLKAKAVITDFVPPGAGVLVRDFNITIEDVSPITEWKFAYFAGLAPSLDKAEAYPVVELDETRHDFAAAYLAQKNVFIQFAPEDESAGKGRLADLKSASSPEDIDAAFGKGVFVAVGMDFTPEGFQVGGDSFTACKKGMPAEFARAGQDAYSDLVDGVLDGNRVNACQSNIAVLKKPSGNTASFRIVFSIAGSAKGAYDGLQPYITRNLDAMTGDVSSDWQAWLDRRKVRFAEPAIDDFVKNTLMTIRMSQDPATRAVVASVATMPAYNFDWPRDGAFINLFLDLMGYREDAELHDIFYSTVQRKQETSYGPAGSWSTYTWSDGTVGTILPGFEIDETGLALWTMSLHASFIDDAAKRSDYLSKVFPAIELGANMLARCKDNKNNMQCAASEDDNMDSTQTLHGAASVYLGLMSSAKAAAALGKSSLADRWNKRAAELKAAILSFYNEKEGHFGNEGWRGGEWIIFPAAVLPAGDSMMKNQADYIRESKVLPSMAPGTEGLNYLGEKLLALAVAYKGDDQRLGELKSWLDFIIKNALTKETGHLGEVTLAGDFNGDGQTEFVNVTSIPHVWEATVLSLTLIAVYHPELLEGLGEFGGGSDTDAGVASDSSYTDAGSGGSGSGCGCSILSID